MWFSIIRPDGRALYKCFIAAADNSCLDASDVEYSQRCHGLHTAVLEVRRPVKQGVVVHTIGGSSQYDSHLAMPIEPSRVLTPPFLEDEYLSIQKLLLQPTVKGR